MLLIIMELLVCALMSLVMDVTVIDSTEVDNMEEILNTRHGLTDRS